MLREIASRLRHADGGMLRRRLLAVYLFLAVLNLGAWALAWALFHDYPTTLGLCFLAYGFGLRHAVDADHIAAIDNVTRKLMQEGQRPVAVGFFFSLGHSTVVILLSLAVALGTGFVQARFPQLRTLGQAVGTSVSALFLLVIAAVNLVILVRVWQAFRALRAGVDPPEAAVNDLLVGGGLLARALRPLFRLVGQSWHLYPIGFLFGLGFDTATEIALLGIAATQAAQQAPLWSVMTFPLLFTAGMCLVDTTDGVVMLGAYGWAFIDPARKLLYNLTITFVSFLTALLVGGLEGLGLIAERLGLDTGVWAWVNAASASSGVLGYGIIGLFVVSWLAAIIVSRGGRQSAANRLPCS